MDGKRVRITAAGGLLLAALGIILGVTGWDRLAGAATAVLAQSPRQAYVAELRTAGRADSAQLQAWRRAEKQAREQPVAIDSAQYTEAGVLRSGADAVAFTFAAERGQTLALRLTRAGDGAGRLFADVYVRGRGGWSYEGALTAGVAQSWRASRTTDYRLILQPELDTAVTYRLAMARGGSLGFPVKGTGIGDIGGVFGDPRDDGARKHHGVDIFAPRGTPVTAVAAGRVRTGRSSLGGKFVWLSASLLGESYYYAHLDEISVASGQRVEAGAVLGGVGNTGNAKATPPHLHFGIYAGGPVDPLPFLRPPPALPPVVAEPLPPATPLSVTASRLHLRAGPSLDATIISGMPRATQVQAVAVSGEWYRVDLADGRWGYAASEWLTPLTNAGAVPTASSQPQ